MGEMPADRVQELGIDDFTAKEPKDPPRRLWPRTRRIPSVLTFPAWVVSNQTRTKHLHLANPLAAFECDGQGAEGLQQGLSYWFTFQVPLEVVLPREPFLWSLSRHYAMAEEDMPAPSEIHLAYQMKWVPDLDGYHQKGRIVLPRGRRGKETDRHRWDLHNYEADGAGLRCSVRCDEDEVHDFAARESKNLVQLYDKDTGRPREKKLPWGLLSAVIGGRRAF